MRMVSSLCKTIGTLPDPRPSPLHRRGGLREGVSWDVYVKDFCEGLDEGIFDLWEGKGRAQFGGHGGDTLIPDAAGDDQAKPLEVGIDVEGEAVHGDPAGEFVLHGGNLTGGI